MKKIKKIVLPLIALIFSVQFFSSSNIKASGNIISVGGEISLNFYFNGLHLETARKQFDDGKIAYCLNMNLASPNNGVMGEISAPSQIQALQLAQVGYLGFPARGLNNGFGLDDDSLRYATQLVVWTITSGLDLNQITRAGGLPIVQGSADQYILDVAKTIKNAINSGGEAKPHFTGNLKPVRILSDGRVFWGGFKASGDVYNLSLMTNTIGFNIVDYNGNSISQIGKNQDFYILAPPKMEIGNITISGDMYYNQTGSVGFYAQTSNVQNVVKVNTDLLPERVSQNYTLSENCMIYLYKRAGNEGDLSAPLLPNAVFQLWRNAVGTGTFIGTYTTDGNGFIAVPNLPVGKYVWKETTAPSGYQIGMNSIKETSGQEGGIGVAHFWNTPVAEKKYGKIKIVKEDSQTGNKLSGAVFEIRDNIGVVIERVTTDSNGNVTSNNLDLEGNPYTIKEVTAPSGYILNVNNTNVTVIENVTISTTVTNDKQPLDKEYGKIKIVKEDSETGTKLAGAVFEIKNVNGTVVERITTDSSGNAISNDLDLEGNPYTVKEVTAPSGYILNINPINITVIKNTTTSTTVLNDKQPVVKEYGKIKIVKEDSKTGSKLAGAVFEIKNVNGTVVERITTDSNGNAISNNLDIEGNPYTIQEIQAPSGYVINVSSINITVLSNNTVTNIVKNDKIIERGSLEIVKEDSETGVKLIGAIFEIKNKNGTIVGTITTNSNGIARLDGLDIEGNPYTYEEKTAPNGYSMNDSSTGNIIVTVNQVTVKTVTNDREKGKIKIIKETDDIGSLNYWTLSGAKFDIINSTGTVVDTIIIESDGTGTSKDIPTGTYTVKETQAPSGYVINVNTQNTTITANNITTINFINHASKGQIKILKGTDDSNSPWIVDGAEFNVIDSKGNVVDHLVITNGEAISKMLFLGQYTIVETKAPTGYTLDTTPRSITIGRDLEIVTLDITNHAIKGQIELTKATDPDCEQDYWALTGAEFNVIDSRGNIVDHLVIGADNKAVTKDLFYGNYTLVEIKAPQGYILDPTPINVTINKDRQVVEITAINHAIKGQIEIRKATDDIGSLDYWNLEGAEFDIIDCRGVVVDHVVIGSDNKAITKLLFCGDYTIKETKAPTGYDLMTTIINVNIVNDREVVEITAINHAIKGKIEVTKDTDDIGSIDYWTLEGTEFDVLDSKGNIVDHIVIGADNKAITKDLFYGEYTLVETKVPTGYVLDSNPIKVTISSDKQIVEINVINHAIKGQIELTKETDDIGSIEYWTLEGAEFDVIDSKGNIVDHIVIGVDNKAITKNLFYGEYTLIETKAPTGYTLNETPIEVTINKDKEIVEITAVNHAIKGQIELTKTDKNTEKLLAGAEFDVIDSKGKIVDHIITNENGIAITKELFYGEYTLIETKAPIGYVLDTTPIKASINNDKEIVKVTMTNKIITNTVVIHKTDATDGSPVEGATIVIVDKNTGEIVFTGITDKNGDITIELPYGTYEFYETVAPNGYILNTAKTEFSINEDGAIYKGHIINERVPVVTVEKLPQTGGTSSNLVFLIGLLFITTSVFMRKNHVKNLK